MSPYTASTWDDTGLKRVLTEYIVPELSENEDVPSLPPIILTSGKTHFGFDEVKGLVSTYERATFAFVHRLYDALCTTLRTMIEDSNRYIVNNFKMTDDEREELMKRLFRPIREARDAFSSELEDVVDRFMRRFTTRLTASRNHWPELVSTEIEDAYAQTIKAILRRRGGPWRDTDLCRTMGIYVHRSRLFVACLCLLL